MRWLSSVRARITLVSTLLTAIALVIASALVLELVERDLIDAAEETLDETISLVEGQDDFGFSLGVEELRGFEVTSPAGDLFLEAGLVDDEEVVEGLLFDPFEEFVGVIFVDPETAEVLEAFDDEGDELPAEFVPDELDAVVTALLGGSVEEVRELSEASLREIRESVDSVRGVLTLVVPVIVALLGIFTWFLVGRALRPVDAITQRVQSISGSTLSERVPEPGTDDEVGHLATVMNDMLDRLEDAAERQQQFVADASHELRSPLSTIKAAAEVGSLDTDNQRAHRMGLDIAAEADRMELMIADLLDLARLDEARRTTLHAVELGELTQRFVDRLASNGVGVRADTRSVWVDGVASQLERLVQNLVENAREHADSSVSILVGAVDGDAALIVEDDGPGIPPADRHRIFDRFVRLDEARARDSGGSGLGLALVRAIVERHGGQIHVGDSAELGGAAFTVTMPLASTQTAPGAPSATS